MSDESAAAEVSAKHLKSTVDAAAALLAKSTALSAARAGRTACGRSTAVVPSSGAPSAGTPSGTLPSTSPSIVTATRGGSVASTSAAVLPNVVVVSSTNAAAKVPSVEEARDAAIAETVRLRRALDAVGDVDERIRVAVDAAVQRERHSHSKRLACAVAEKTKELQTLKDANLRLSADLRVKDEKISVLLTQLQHHVGPADTSQRLSKLQEQTAFLTSELLRRDTLVDKKTTEVNAVHRELASREAALSDLRTQLAEQQDRFDTLTREVQRMETESHVAAREYESRVHVLEQELDALRQSEKNLQREVDEARQRHAAESERFGTKIAEFDAAMRDCLLRLDEAQESERGWELVAGNIRAQALQSMETTNVVQRILAPRFLTWLRVAKTRGLHRSMLLPRHRSDRETMQAEAELVMVRCHRDELLQRVELERTQRMSIERIVKRSIHASSWRQASERYKEERLTRELELRCDQLAVQVRQLSTDLEERSAERDRLDEQLRAQALRHERQHHEQQDAVAMSKLEAEEARSRLGNLEAVIQARNREVESLRGFLAKERELTSAVRVQLAEAESGLVTLRAAEGEHAHEALTWRATVTRLRAANEELTVAHHQACAAWGVERQSLHDEVTTLRGELGQSNAERVSQDARENALRRQLDASTHLAQERGRLVTQREAELVELRHEVARLMRIQSELEVRLAGAEARVESPQPETNATTSTQPDPSVELQVQLRTSQRECELWKAQAETARQKAEAAESARVTLEASVLNGGAHEIAELSRQLQESQDEATRLAATNRHLVDELRSQGQKLLAAELDVASARMATDTANGKLHDAIRRVAELESDQAAVASEERMREQAEGRAKDVRERLLAVQRECQAANAKYRECESLLRDKDRQVEELQDEKKSLAIEVRVLQDELHEIRAFSGEMQQAYEALSKPHQPHAISSSSSSSPSPPASTRGGTSSATQSESVVAATPGETSAEVAALRRQVTTLQEALLHAASQVRYQDPSLSPPPSAASTGARAAPRQDSAAEQENLADVRELSRLRNALSTLESSKMLLEARLQEVAVDESAVVQMLESRQRAEQEARLSFLHALSVALGIKTPASSSFPELKEAEKRVFMALQSLKSAGSVQQQPQQGSGSIASSSDSGGKGTRSAERETEQHEAPRRLGWEPAVHAEMEVIVQKLGMAHRREVVNLRRLNASLVELVRRGLPLAGNSSPSEVDNTRRTAYFVWLLFVERRKKEYVTVCANATIQKLQEQVVKLREIAAEAVHRTRR